MSCIVVSVLFAAIKKIRSLSGSFGPQSCSYILYRCSVPSLLSVEGRPHAKKMAHCGNETDFLVFLAPSPDQLLDVTLPNIKIYTLVNLSSRISPGMWRNWKKTLEKMWHTWKNASHLEVCTTLEKNCHG